MQSIKTFIKSAFTTLFVDRRATKRLSRLEYQDLVAVVVFLRIVITFIIFIRMTRQDLLPCSCHLGKEYEYIETINTILLSISKTWTIFSWILLIKLGIRRSKDLNESPWFFLLLLVPVLNLYFILRLLFFSGTLWDNKYGPDPRGNHTIRPLTLWISSLVKIIIFATGATWLIFLMWHIYLPQNIVSTIQWFILYGS